MTFVHTIFFRQQKMTRLAASRRRSGHCVIKLSKTVCYLLRPNEITKTGTSHSIINVMALLTLAES